MFNSNLEFINVCCCVVNKSETIGNSCIFVKSYGKNRNSDVNCIRELYCKRSTIKAGELGERTNAGRLP
jgi:hypothetical protein